MNFSLMSETNPYKPDDKVFIKIKGAEVEATVRLVWKDEVQVRVSGGSLLWRTVRTVKSVASPGAETPAAPVAGTDPGTETVVSPAIGTDAGTSNSAQAAPANESGASPEATSVVTSSVTSAESVQPSAGGTEQIACGGPEVEADRKRAKKSKRSR
jgi:hypothetical protein